MMNELNEKLRKYLIEHGFTFEKAGGIHKEATVHCSKKESKDKNKQNKSEHAKKNTVKNKLFDILFEIPDCEEDYPCIFDGNEINPYASNLEEAIKNIDESFVQRMFRYMDDKKLDEVEVYKRAGIDRKLFSKMRSDYLYQPSKVTAICMALGMRLNKEETDDLLEKAGYKLNDSLMFDVIVRFFIENGVYDIYTIDKALLEYDQRTLLRY